MQNQIIEECKNRRECYHIKIEVRKELMEDAASEEEQQSFTKYLRQTLVFM